MTCKNCIHWEVCKTQYDGTITGAVSTEIGGCTLFRYNSASISSSDFDYGTIVYKHRFSINRSLNDYKETTLTKCIRMGVVYKYHTPKDADENRPYAEVQIIYKDKNNKPQCFKGNLEEFTFEIKHLGQMQIIL